VKLGLVLVVGGIGGEWGCGWVVLWFFISLICA